MNNNYNKQMRKCKKCGEEKELTEFHKNKPSKEGRLNTCKSCSYLINKDWVSKHKDDVRAYQIAYCIKNKEALKIKIQNKKHWTKANNKKRDRIKNDYAEYGFGAGFVFHFGIEKVIEVYDYFFKKCCFCGSTKDLCIHHKDFLGYTHTKEPNNDISNLLLLCRSCHMKYHRKIEKENTKIVFPIITKL